ncbi:uncharacterized protein KY384_008943 [Bacidia gigantensis]|uniref:uncharacterized protein n=1 Tax=Bacidia gigantensis TaxID=2732470 RepID=UPI001D05AD7F|nr:uncharacterized protein KY384_008943 [Bacidia gigantensis]KAG8525299.1 hypothetical protein KY384_008943 [Bacidia gigantensis]
MSPSKRIKLDPDGKSKGEKKTSSPPVVESTFDQITTLRIGPEGKIFNMHCGLLCKSSEVFNTLLSIPKDSSKAMPVPITDCHFDFIQNSLSMPNEDVEMFTRVNHWYYANELVFEEKLFSTLTWPMLVSIYAFAVKYKVLKLQNKCIDTTIMKHKADKFLPNADTMTKLWRTDVGAAPLRRLFFALYATDCDLSSLPGNFSAAFLKGLIAELYRMKVDKVEHESFKFWKMRHTFYVSDASNPLIIDK